MSRLFQPKFLSLGQLAKPSWCLLVRTKYLAPLAATSSAQAVALKKWAESWEPNCWYLKSGGKCFSMNSRISMSPGLLGSLLFHWYQNHYTQHRPSPQLFYNRIKIFQ